MCVCVGRHTCSWSTVHSNSCLCCVHYSSWQGSRVLQFMLPGPALGRQGYRIRLFWAPHTCSSRCFLQCKVTWRMLCFGAASVCHTFPFVPFLGLWLGVEIMELSPLKQKQSVCLLIELSDWRRQIWWQARMGVEQGNTQRKLSMNTRPRETIWRRQIQIQMASCCALSQHTSARTWKLIELHQYPWKDCAGDRVTAC